MTYLQSLKTNFLLCAGLFLVAYLFQFYWLLPIIGILLLLGGLSESIAKFIAKSWWSFGKIVGWINAKILLTIIYFIILTPLAIISRLLHTKSQLTLSKPEKSTFRNQETSFDATYFEKPF